MEPLKVSHFEGQGHILRRVMNKVESDSRQSMILDGRRVLTERVL